MTSHINPATTQTSNFTPPAEFLFFATSSKEVHSSITARSNKSIAAFSSHTCSKFKPNEPSLVTPDLIALINIVCRQHSQLQLSNPMPPKKSPKVNKPATPPPNSTLRSSSPTPSTTSSHSSIGNRKRTVTSPEDRDSSNLKQMRSDNLQVLNDDFVNNKLSLLNVNREDNEEDLLLDSDNDSSPENYSGRTNVSHNDPDGLITAIENSKSENELLHRALLAAQAKIDSMEASGSRARGPNYMPTGGSYQGSNPQYPEPPNANPQLALGDGIAGAQGDNNGAEIINGADAGPIINLVIKPTEYPKLVITDDWTKIIESKVNGLLRKGKNLIDMSGLKIDTCKFGLMFLSCRNEFEATSITTIVTRINWTRDGMPALECVPAAHVSPAPVLEFWIPVKDETFFDACAVAKAHLGSTIDNWKLIKRIDNPRRKGTVFVFVSDDVLADRISAGGTIFFKYGFNISRATIKFPLGYRGKSLLNMIHLIFNNFFKFKTTDKGIKVKAAIVLQKTSRISSSPKFCAKQRPSSSSNAVAATEGSGFLAKQLTFHPKKCLSSAPELLSSYYELLIIKRNKADKNFKPNINIRFFYINLMVSLHNAPVLRKISEHQRVTQRIVQAIFVSNLPLINTAFRTILINFILSYLTQFIRSIWNNG